MKRFHSRLLSFLLAVAIASVAPASYAATLSTTAAAALPAAATGVAITVASDAPSAVHSAVADLAAALTKVFPSDNFAISPAAATAATARRIEIVIAGRGLSGAPAPAPESFRIEKINNCTGVRVSGADTLGAVYGIYALLESYGCGFYLTYDTLPAPKKEKWTPPENNISDAPLAKERYSFNWHNFLSGCSGWDLAEWKRWIDQCRKMRFNVLMVHAYGNNPMFTFSFRGVQKKSGFLASTAAGRDWGTPHVNDVRRLVGGEFFTAANTGPIFGTPPSLLPREQQPAATQLFMKQVFAYAKAQGMKIAFQLDIDTASAIPSAMLEKLPASAKIKMGKTLRPNPETPDGKDYYKTIFTTLLATYPEINTLVICVRTDPVPEAGNFDASAFPETWKQACSAAVKNNPALQNKRRVAAYFWIGKVIKTFQEIARETGHADTPIHLATWNLKPWIDYANAFSPKETAFLPLDYRELFNQSELASAKDLAWLRKIAQSGRRVIPIIWSHHDDGNYIGRPHTPFENFASLLEEAGCESFGIIHWLLRPQSLHFKSHSTQVWKTTKNQPLKETSRIMARHLFGEENETKGGAYFYDWITNGPIFGRETTEFMIGYVNHIFSRKRYAQIQEGTKNRLQLLQQIKVSPDKPNAQKHLEYWRGLEKFNEHFYRAELALQEGVFALKKSRLREVAEIAEDINPDAVIEDFTRYASKLDMTRGDLGLLVPLNLKWRAAFVGLRQMAGRETFRYNFAPTVHEPQAQGAGKRSFYITPDKELWRVSGVAEISSAAAKCEIWSWPKEKALRADNLSNSQKEIVQTGLRTQADTLRIPVFPAMAPFSAQGVAIHFPKNSKLRLYIADPLLKENSASEFDVFVADASGKTQKLGTVTPTSGVATVVGFDIPAAFNRNLSLVFKRRKGAISLSGFELGEPTQPPEKKVP